MSAVMPTYARADIAFERGEGPYLISTDGRRYLDFAAGVAVNAFGHAHPRLVAVLKEQAEKLWHTSNLYRVPGQERVAATLIAHSFAETVFFCNSGAEAMEGVIKVIRKFHDAHGRPERKRIVVMEGAFHGRTMATLAAGGNEKHMHGFGPHLDGFDRVPFGNLNELRNVIGPQTGGIIVEPVQGEGGIRPADVSFLRGVRAAADEFGLLLGFDEVQTGIGRTGTLFAHQAAGITPDVMGIAKGLGAGFPVGAVLATEKAAVGMTAGTHGSTFGGNPLAMAVAETVLDMVLEDGLLARVQDSGDRLAEGLARLVDRYPTVIEQWRGRGLMLGLKCVLPNTTVVAALRDNGLLTVAAGDNVVRLLPPLIIEPAHITEALATLDRTFADLTNAGLSTPS